MNELRACLSVSGAFLLAALLGTAPPVYAQKDAGRATPPPGKALMFVFRTERVPVAARVPVFVNLARVGELANGTFVMATVNPGKTLLRLGDQAAPTYAFEAAANRSYFVRVEALAGVQPVRTEVRLVTETEGRRSLAQSRFLGAVTAAAAPRVQPPPAPAATPPRVQPPAAPAAGAQRAAPAPTPIVAVPRVQPPLPPAKRAPEPEPEEPSPFDEFGSDWKLAVIASGGAFKLANGSQTVAGLASTYDTTSSPVLGVAAEWRSKGGFAAGGEVFYYKNDLVTTTTGLISKQQVLAIMGNAKYYFHAADWFYPFVGAGIGMASATYSGGSLEGNAGGLAYQGLAGMEFRFGSVGVHVGYKYLAATTGKSDKVKVGGGGVLAGVSFTF